LAETKIAQVQKAKPEHKGHIQELDEEAPIEPKGDDEDDGDARLDQAPTIARNLKRKRSDQLDKQVRCNFLSNYVKFNSFMCFQTESNPKRTKASD